MMKTVPTRHETLQFAVESRGGSVTHVGRSYIWEPKTSFAGGSVKWFDDSRLIRGGGAA